MNQHSVRMGYTLPSAALLFVVLAGAHGWTELDYSLITGLGQRESSSWVIAPVSISSALGMLYLGARNETALQIGKLLSLPPSYNEAKRRLFEQQLHLKEPTNDVKVTWEMANKILVSKDFPLNRNLQNEVAVHFDSEVVNADFNNIQQVTKDVNSWASNKTHGFIPHLLSPEAVTEDTKLILLNAVYFKGLWKVSFDEKRTHQQCFYAKPGNCTRVDFMNQKNSFLYGYSTSLKSKILKLAYTDPDYSMVIILPDEKSSVGELAAALVDVDIKRTVNLLYETTVTVSIPKFTCEYSRELTQDLTSAGMDLAFSNKANLTGFSEVKIPLKVSTVIHKTKIIVSEAGTEAAGATGIVAIPVSYPSPPIEELYFKANRPFLYFIMHRDNALFTGSYKN